MLSETNTIDTIEKRKELDWISVIKLSMLKGSLIRKIKEITGLVLIIFFLFLSFETVCFAEQPSASQIERTQEILKEEEVLRDKLKTEEKLFIKKIIVKGVTLFDEDEIKKITLPFQKHWLSKTDIQQILGAIGQAYKQKGYAGQPLKSSFEVKKSCLRINIEEK